MDPLAVQVAEDDVLGESASRTKSADGTVRSDQTPPRGLTPMSGLSGPYSPRGMQIGKSMALGRARMGVQAISSFKTGAHHVPFDPNEPLCVGSFSLNIDALTEAITWLVGQVQGHQGMLGEVDAAVASLTKSLKKIESDVEQRLENFKDEVGNDSQFSASGQFSPLGRRGPKEAVELARTATAEAVEALAEGQPITKEVFLPALDCMDELADHLEYHSQLLGANEPGSPAGGGLGGMKRDLDKLKRWQKQIEADLDHQKAEQVQKDEAQDSMLHMELDLLKQSIQVRMTSDDFERAREGIVERAIERTQVFVDQVGKELSANGASLHEQLVTANSALANQLKLINDKITLRESRDKHREEEIHEMVHNELTKIRAEFGEAVRLSTAGGAGSSRVQSALPGLDDGSGDSPGSRGKTPSSVRANSRAGGKSPSHDGDGAGHELPDDFPVPSPEAIQMLHDRLLELEELVKNSGISELGGPGASKQLHQLASAMGPRMDTISETVEDTKQVVDGVKSDVKGIRESQEKSTHRIDALERQQTQGLAGSQDQNASAAPAEGAAAGAAAGVLQDVDVEALRIFRDESQIFAELKTLPREQLMLMPDKVKQLEAMLLEMQSRVAEIGDGSGQGHTPTISEMTADTLRIALHAVDVLKSELEEKIKGLEFENQQLRERTESMDQTNEQLRELQRKTDEVHSSVTSVVKEEALRDAVEGVEQRVTATAHGVEERAAATAIGVEERATAAALSVEERAKATALGVEERTSANMRSMEEQARLATEQAVADTKAGTLKMALAAVGALRIELENRLRQLEEEMRQAALKDQKPGQRERDGGIRGKMDSLSFLEDRVGKMAAADHEKEKHLQANDLRSSLEKLQEDHLVEISSLRSKLADAEKRITALEPKAASEAEDDGIPPLDVQQELERFRRLFEYLAQVVPPDAQKAMNFFLGPEQRKGNRVKALQEMELQEKLEKATKDLEGHLQHEMVNFSAVMKGTQRDVSASSDRLERLEKLVPTLLTSLDGLRKQSNTLGGALADQAALDRCPSSSSNARTASRGSRRGLSTPGRPSLETEGLLGPRLGTPQVSTPHPFVSQRGLGEVLESLRADVRSWLEVLRQGILELIQNKADADQVKQLAAQIGGVAGELVAYERGRETSRSPRWETDHSAFVTQPLIGSPHRTRHADGTITCAACDSPLAAFDRTVRREGIATSYGQFPQRVLANHPIVDPRLESQRKAVQKQQEQLKPMAKSASLPAIAKERNWLKIKDKDAPKEAPKALD